MLSFMIDTILGFFMCVVWTYLENNTVTFDIS